MSPASSATLDPTKEAADTDTQTDAIAMRALLISIQPRHARAILEGRKSIELRRRMPKLAPGAVALIYASTPTRAMVGWAHVAEILQGSPASIWRAHRHGTEVSSAEFRDYFEGAETAYGLRLNNVTAALQPLSLARMRNHDLEPPQSWRYMLSSTAAGLQREMHGTRDVALRPPTG